MNEQARNKLLTLVRCGLPPAAIVALTAMALDNKTSLHVNDLAKLARLRLGDADTVGRVFRSKGVASFKNGNVVITNKDVLSCIKDLHTVAVAPAPPAPVDIKKPAVKRADKVVKPAQV